MATVKELIGEAITKVWTLGGLLAGPTSLKRADLPANMKPCPDCNAGVLHRPISWIRTAMIFVAAAAVVVPFVLAAPKILLVVKHSIAAGAPVLRSLDALWATIWVAVGLVMARLIHEEFDIVRNVRAWMFGDCPHCYGGWLDNRVPRLRVFIYFLEIFVFKEILIPMYEALTFQFLRDPAPVEGAEPAPAQSAGRKFVGKGLRAVWYSAVFFGSAPFLIFLSGERTIAGLVISIAVMAYLVWLIFSSEDTEPARRFQKSVILLIIPLYFVCTVELYRWAYENSPGIVDRPDHSDLMWLGVENITRTQAFLDFFTVYGLELTKVKEHTTITKTAVFASRLLLNIAILALLIKAAVVSFRRAWLYRQQGYPPEEVAGGSTLTDLETLSAVGRASDVKEVSKALKKVGEVLRGAGRYLQHAAVTGEPDHRAMAEKAALALKSVTDTPDTTPQIDARKEVPWTAQVASMSVVGVWAAAFVFGMGWFINDLNNREIANLMADAAKQGDIHRKTRLYSRVLEKDPTRADARLARARAELDVVREDVALVRLDRALLDIDKLFADLIELQNTQGIDGPNAEAIRELSAAAYVERGRVYQFRAEPERALAEMDKERSRDLRRMRYLVQIDAGAKALGGPGSAERFSEAAAALGFDPQFGPRILLNLSDALSAARKGELEAAETALDEFLQTAAKEKVALSSTLIAEVWCELGAVRLRLGRLKDAGEAYTRAAEIAPDLKEAHLGRADVNRAAGKTADATADYRNVTESRTGSPLADDRARLGLALLLAADGKRDDAAARFGDLLRNRRPAPDRELVENVPEFLAGKLTGEELERRARTTWDLENFEADSCRLDFYQAVGAVLRKDTAAAAAAYRRCASANQPDIPEYHQARTELELISIRAEGRSLNPTLYFDVTRLRQWGARMSAAVRTLAFPPDESLAVLRRILETGFHLRLSEYDREQLVKQEVPRDVLEALMPLEDSPAATLAEFDALLAARLSPAQLKTHRWTLLRHARKSGYENLAGKYLDESADRRASAIASLAPARVVDAASLVEPLALALFDRHRDVRLAAARGLGDLTELEGDASRPASAAKTAADSAAFALSVVLTQKSEDPIKPDVGGKAKPEEIRQAAVRALAALGSIDGLLVALNDDDKFVRRDAAYALPKFGARAGIALPKLRLMLDDEEIVARDAALAAVIAMGAAPETAADPAVAELRDAVGQILLNTALNNRRSQMRALALKDLAERRPRLFTAKIDALRPKLIELLTKDEDEQTRRWAARRIVEAGVDEHLDAAGKKELTQRLAQLLADRDPQVRLGSALWLLIAADRSGLDGAPALAVLRERLTAGDGNDRKRVAADLIALRRAAVAPAKTLAADTDPRVREAGRQVLRTLLAEDGGLQNAQRPQRAAMVEMAAGLLAAPDEKNRELGKELMIKQLADAAGAGAVVNRLVGLAASKDEAVRQSAQDTVFELGQALEPAAAIPVLVEMILSQPTLREIAVGALPASPDYELPADLSKRLAEGAARDAAIMPWVIKALAVVKAPSDPWADTLLAAAKDPDAEVRAAAVAGLRHHPDRLDRSRETLTAALADAEGSVKSAAAASLARLLKADGLWELALTKDEPVRLLAAEALRGVGPAADTKVGPTLVKMTAGKEPAVRLAAIGVLQSFGPEAAPAAPVLEKLLEDADTTVAKAAGRALMYTASGRPSATVPTVAALTDESPEVVMKALEVIAATGRPYRSHADALVKLLGRKEPAELPAAVEKAIASLGDAAVPDLVAAMDNPSRDVRRAAAQAIGKVGPDAATGATVKLVVTAGGKDPVLAAAAMQALADIRARDAMPKLREIAASQESPVPARFHARLALHQLGDAVASAELTKLPDVDATATKAMVQELATRAPGIAVDVLRKALRDRYGPVDAVAAVRMLQTLGPAAEPARIELAEAAGDRNPDLRTAARDALAALGR